ncbi:MAG: hypothetical protein R3E18_13550 [Sphingomonadaceae bacterium]|nr:hypothetical protein [Sphingomonadaceae bacterium]
MSEPVLEYNEAQGDLVEVVEHPEAGHGGEHAVPSAFGIGPTAWVSLAMLVLLAIAFFGAKVHKTIAGGLDSKIAAIKQQLDEAKALRAEAEALRDEYAAKIANAEKDAEAMIEHAKSEAGHIVEKAEADSKAMIERRKKMAEEKIAAAERNAVDEVRAVAVNAATLAARGLIADKHDAEADRKLADELIAGL